MSNAESKWPQGYDSLLIFLDTLFHHLFLPLEAADQ